MATVTSLATHLLKLLKPNGLQGGHTVDATSAAQLALYGFLKNFCEANEPLLGETLERFVRWSLNSAHWQKHKVELFRELHNSLQHFASETGQAVPLCRFTDPSDIQVVHLESRKALFKMAEAQVQLLSAPTDQTRMIEDEKGRIVVLKVDAQRALSVFIFDTKAALIDGQIEPLLRDHEVHYNSELSISSSRASTLEVSDNTFVRFRSLNRSAISAIAIRGFTFNKVDAFSGEELSRLPVLFYPLKRLERLYINRASDPLYTELTGLLEKAIELLSEAHPESRRFAEAAMDRGLIALEQVYLEDKMLRLLLDNLNRALELSQRSYDLSRHQSAGLRSHEFDSVQGTNSERELVRPPSTSLEQGQDPHLGIDPYPLEGPDLVELQEAEPCEVLKPSPGL